MPWSPPITVPKLSFLHKTFYRRSFAEVLPLCSTHRRCPDRVATESGGDGQGRWRCWNLKEGGQQPDPIRTTSSLQQLDWMFPGCLNHGLQLDRFIQLVEIAPKVTLALLLMKHPGHELHEPSGKDKMSEPNRSLGFTHDTRLQGKPAAL